MVHIVTTKHDETPAQKVVIIEQGEDQRRQMSRQITVILLLYIFIE